MKIKAFLKKNIDNIIVFCFCSLALVLGLCLTTNEISQDHWYIEGSADGLFGQNNRSLMTLGSNFIITGLIYILSLTGIRIYWFHILLFFLLFVSNIVVCKIIINNIKSWLKYVAVVLFLIIITSLTLIYQLNYSAIAAYAISVGCLILFDYIENERSYKRMLFGGGVIVLGAAVRTDSIYFSFALMGIIWLCKVIEKCFGKSFKEIKKIFLKYFLPFFGCLCILVIMNLAQNFWMQYEEGNYYEWNKMRAQIDDWMIPDYYEYEDEYEELGISENDYKVLKSWNNQDENIFTKEVVENISDFSSQVQKEKFGNIKASGYLINAWKALSSYIEFWLLLFIMLIIILFVDKRLIFGICSILFVDILLTVYFLYIGKTIGTRHLFVSIISVTYIAIIGLLLGRRYKEHCVWTKNYKIVMLVVVICGGALFINPGKESCSLWDSYKVRREDENKLYSHLKYKDELKGKTETFNPTISKYIEEDKENFYYRLFVFDWYAQQYPLTDRNLLFTAPIGAAENWGTLGQYQMKLSPIENNIKKYGVKNPIPDLIHDNIRVEVKENCIEEAVNPLNLYLKEHYYKDVDFCIIKGISNSVIGRFIQSLELDKIEKREGNLKVNSELQESRYEGMIEISFKLKGNHEKTQQVYLQIEGEKKEKFCYEAIMESDDTGKIIIPVTSIKAGKEYKIIPVLEDDEKFKLDETIVRFEEVKR